MLLQNSSANSNKNTYKLALLRFTASNNAYIHLGLGTRLVIVDGYTRCYYYYLTLLENTQLKIIDFGAYLTRRLVLPVTLLDKIKFKRQCLQ